MIRIAGVQFRGAGKIYSFDAKNMDLSVGTGVIVETSQGCEYGVVVAPVREEYEEDSSMEYKPVVRIATDDDIKRVRENASKEEQAYEICSKKIEEHKLDMKLVDVEFIFDGTKMLFYFTSDGRVDFRDLVKDLASTFHTRIELRQIGVRDEARTLGGLGICGREFCCSSFLTEFQPVSIKMAKEQGLSLNPTKISGTCGRLMCCLKYEQEAYEDLIRRIAPIGSYVKTPDGEGYVADYHLLTGILKIKLDSSADGALRSFKNCDVTILRRPERRGKDKKTDKTEKIEIEETNALVKEQKRVEPEKTEQKPPVKIEIKDALFSQPDATQPVKPQNEKQNGGGERKKHNNHYRKNNKHHGKKSETKASAE